MTIAEINRELKMKTAALQESFSREFRAAERAAHLKPFGPQGQWRYAPAEEKAKAAKNIAAEQDRRTGQALYALGRLILDVEPVVHGTAEMIRRPLSPEQAWTQRTGSAGHTAEVLLQLGILDELRTVRLGAELRTSSPSQWLNRYDEALADPTEQSSATTIRVIETLLDGDTWAGKDIARQPNEAAQMLRLRQKVQQAREDRVPDELRATLVLLKDAKRIEKIFEELHHIVPLSPEMAGATARADA